jgi:hypothetical protein
MPILPTTCAPPCCAMVSCFPSMPVLPQTGSDRGGQQQAVHRAEGSPEGQEEEAVADRPLAGFNFASVIPTYST